MAFTTATRTVFYSALNACRQHLRAPSARNLGNAKPKCDLAINDYNVPVTKYNVPITEYNVPMTRYSRPITEYNGPLTTYNEPITRYNEPITEYNAPVTEFNVPITKYNGPITEYNGPITEYNVPLTRFEAPVTKVNLPITTENAPVTVSSGPPNMFNPSAAESVVPKSCTLWGLNGPRNKRNVLWDATRFPTMFEANRFLNTDSRTSDMESRTSDAPCGPIEGPISNPSPTLEVTTRLEKAFQESGGSTLHDVKDVPTVPPEPLSGHEDMWIDNGSILEMATRELVERFLADFCGLSNPQWFESSDIKVMKVVVDEVLQTHGADMREKLDQLLLEAGDDDMSLVSFVARFMFADGNVTWERIVVLLAFGAILCQRLLNRGRDGCVLHVARDIVTFLIREQKDWLLNNNAWEGFVKHFGVVQEKSTFKKIVLASAGLVGVGVTLAGVFAYISSR